jgi:hypothetical protein
VGEEQKRGLRLPWSWARKNKPAGTITIETEHDALVPIYSFHRFGSTEWRDVRQRVPVMAQGVVEACLSIDVRQSGRAASNNGTAELICCVCGRPMMQCNPCGFSVTEPASWTTRPSDPLGPDDCDLLPRALESM